MVASRNVGCFLRVVLSTLKHVSASIWNDSDSPEYILRSLRNGDGNENGKKAIGLDWQNNCNFARVSRFFAHFFAVAARLQREGA